MSRTLWGLIDVRTDSVQVNAKKLAHGLLHVGDSEVTSRSMTFDLKVNLAIGEC